MKVKVVEMFRDKYTNEIYKEDKILDVDEKRFAEMGKFVEIVKAKNENTEEPTEAIKGNNKTK